MSSAMMSSGLPDCMTFSRSGQQVLDVADLGVRDEHVGVVEHGLHALGVGDEVGTRPLRPPTDTEN